MIVDQHCQRSTSCLCDLSPPPLVRNCLQCVVTAMGEYSEFISHYVATSQSQLTGAFRLMPCLSYIHTDTISSKAYATACGDSLDVSLKMMNHEGVLVSLASLGVTTPPRATVPSVICMLDTTPSATAPSAYFGPQGVFHQLFPYLSFACAFFLTMMTQFHR
jgi:hypothetical protein